MKRFYLLLILGCASTWAAAEPRVFAPLFLKLGAVNELYVWDEAPIGAFSVELRRAGAEKAFAVVKGFSVASPLSVLGAGNRSLNWSAALLAPDALEAPGPVVVRFVAAKGKVLGEVASEIHPRSFPSEKIPLDEAMSDLRSKPDPRKDREVAEIWKIYQTFNPTVWTGDRFLRPVPLAFRTSAQFGDVREFLYADGKSARDYHRGTDFAVPEGTQVVAPAPGTVVLVANRLLTGTTIVVEHAPSVYSVYFHLSKAQVKKGQKVAAGDGLALSGATGLVTGPHLHWEVRVGGVPVDALDLITDGLLDTNTVSAVISSVERSIH